MAYTITFVQKGNCLYARVEGENTPENVLKYLAEVQKTCLQYKCSKILIEENLAGPTISTFDIFTIINQASQNIPSDIQQIAYVDVNQKHDREAMHFAETVALNRGVNIKLFSDIKLAEEWLTSHIPKV